MELQIYIDTPQKAKLPLHVSSTPALMHLCYLHPLTLKIQLLLDKLEKKMRLKLILQKTKALLKSNFHRDF